MKKEIKVYLVQCDAYQCLSSFTTHDEDEKIENAPEGWFVGNDTCYGSDHYYKDGYSCFKVYCPTHAHIAERGGS